jgi:hypothetical protein
MTSYTGPLKSSKTNTVSHEPSFINSAPVEEYTMGTAKALKKTVKTITPYKHKRQSMANC